MKSAARPTQPTPEPSSTTLKASKKSKPASSRIIKAGTRCVHPQHGVVEVNGVVERDVGGTRAPFYELSPVTSTGKLFVPVAVAERAGLRPIMSEREADDLIRFLKEPRSAPDARPFQKRIRAYADQLRSGDLTAVAEVLRDMTQAAAAKDLSFAEKKIHTQAHAMLATELAYAKNVTIEEIDRELGIPTAA